MGKTRTLRSGQEIIRFFAGIRMDEMHRTYVANHARRYARLLACVDRAVAEWRSRNEACAVKILDVGAFFQTELLRHSLSNASVDTLGLRDAGVDYLDGTTPVTAPRLGERHIEFDLNGCGGLGVPAIGPYQVIVMAEVLEHLHTSPATVLRCLREWLAPLGYLVLQTPNAVALHKRLTMLFGRTPHEMIRESRTNPGHFREYTVKELVDIAACVGFEVRYLLAESYFDHYGWPRWIALPYRVLTNLLPAGMRTGITVMYRRT